MPHPGSEPTDREHLGDDSLTLSLDALIALRHTTAEAAPPTEGRGPWTGPFRAATRGQGLEVDDLRPYLPGDDPRHIDWKTSARLGEPHTRLYREERDHALCIVLDLRDTMFTGFTRLRATEAALLAVRCLWRATAQGSRVSLVVFDADGVHRSRPARGARGALPACALVHARHAQRLMMLGGASGTDPTSPPDLSTLVDRLLGEGRRLGSVQLVSGLDDALIDPATHAALGRELARLALAGPLRVTLIEDELERAPLPAGTYRYRGTGGTVRLRMNRSQGTTVSRALRARRAALETLCRRTGASFDELRSVTMAGNR